MLLLPPGVDVSASIQGMDSGMEQLFSAFFGSRSYVAGRFTLEGTGKIGHEQWSLQFLGNITNENKATRR